MRRTVSCRIAGDIREATAAADLVLAVAPAAGYLVDDELLAVTLDGRPLDVHELADEHGARLHRATGFGDGHLDVTYSSTVVGTAPPPPPPTELEVIRYLRPSRYAESDSLAAHAADDFRELEGRDLLDAVSSWVGQRLAYVSGSSRPIDGAIATFLAREGVCRDFTHLVVALLRARDVPARLVSVYAPGLSPMDFHAVAEAAIDGEWLVVDATRLAPRQTMVRIATGRDAADTAFLTNTGCSLSLTDLEVSAVVDGDLPVDDLTLPVALG